MEYKGTEYHSDADSVKVMEEQQNTDGRTLKLKTNLSKFIKPDQLTTKKKEED
jgi:hypothetical protein